jgi:hypothetical protein
MPQTHTAIMHGFLDSNLIRLFDFYLALMLVIGLWRRRRVYWDSIRITMFTMERRKLLERVGEHKHLLLNRDVIRPLLLVLGLMVVQWICSRMLWPQATVVVREVVESWWRLLLVVAAFIPMFAVDVYFIVRVGRFDRGETEKYLDQAETWLGWRAPLVRTLTLGLVNPTRIVDAEVKKGLEELGKTASWAMNWASVQAALRTTFGLTVWLMWVFG